MRLDRARGTLAGAIAVTVSALAPAVRADPTSNDLAAARTLFAEALQDENAGRYAVALLKFEKVRDVRDTASIEYRIGTCEEALADPGHAHDAYQAAVALGRQDPKTTDVALAASERLDALEKQGVRGTPPPPPTAPSPVASSAPVTPPTALEGGGHARETAGWIAVGVGAGLVATSALLFVVRHEAIDRLNDACPGGLCPAGADASELESTRSRALVEGPAGVASGVVGLAAIGAGIYLVTRRDPASPRIVPLGGTAGLGVALCGRFR